MGQRQRMAFFSAAVASHHLNHLIVLKTIRRPKSEGIEFHDLNANTEDQTKLDHEALLKDRDKSKPMSEINTEHQTELGDLAGSTLSVVDKTAASACSGNFPF